MFFLGRNFCYETVFDLNKRIPHIIIFSEMVQERWFIWHVQPTARCNVLTANEIA